MQDYLQSALSAIKAGVEGDKTFLIDGSVEFDLAVTNVKEGGGGLKIYVANASGKLKSEEVSHIKLKVRKDHSSENVVIGDRSYPNPNPFL